MPKQPTFTAWLPLLAAGGLATAMSTAAAAPGMSYPETPVREVVHTYGNVRLPDPFAWLEADETPEVEAWFRAQNAFAREFLTTLPDRPALYERIKELDEAKSVQIYGFSRVHERYFYYKREVGEEVAKLFYRDGIGGEDRLLVDPADYAESEMIHSIDWYAVDPSGKRLAVGIAPGGSEIPTLHLIDVESGENLGLRIPRVSSSARWLEEGNGFYYTQLRPQDTSEPPAERYKRKPAKFHRLGTDAETDPVVISSGVNTLPGQSDVDTPLILDLERTPYTAAILSHGVDPSLTVFIAEGARPDEPETIQWKPLVSREDKIEDFDIYKDRIFFRSAKDAPRMQILTGNLPNFDKGKLEVLLPESHQVISDMAVLGSRLYVITMDGGIDRVLTLDLEASGAAFEEIDLPLIGNVSLLANDFREEDVFFAISSWNRATAYYRYDPETETVAMSPLRPLGPYDSPEGITVKRVLVPSHDGVEVPLTIVHKASLVRDGSNPVLLYGYGAYGLPQTPSFGPIRLAWLERGGIFAVAHVRGGGEYGKAWHEGGHLETKRNSWLDFHACAEYLTEKAYSSPAHIGAYGGSMGGVLVGRAMTSRPDLYGAIVSSVGNHNPVRNHRRANGPANYPEYGNPTDPEEFPYVLAMDSYFAVREGVDYPPVLLTSGYNDARVDPWMPGKMAARLQQLNPGGGPFLMRVEFEAGHGGVARSDIREEIADVYAFLFWALQ